MVFRIPPADGLQRKVVKKVKEHVREAERRGLSTAKTLPSTTTTSTSVQWPGHVVDPAWLKANSASEPKPERVTDWKEMILDGIADQINGRFDPKQAETPPKAPVVMWEPLMNDFMEGLAFVIQRALDEPAFLAKIQGTPGGLVDPKPQVMPEKLREALSAELYTLLRNIQEAVDDGLASYSSLLDTSLDTKVVRSVWEHDIKEAEAGEIGTDEIVEEAMKDMDDMELEREAGRRGYRMTRF